MIVKYFLCAIALGSAARALTEIAEKCQQEIEEEIFKINKRFGDDDTECVDEGKLEDARCPKGQKCVPYYLCNEDGTLNRDGRSVMDERTIDQEPVNKCPMFNSCCSKNRQICPPIDTAINKTEDCIGQIDECGYGNTEDVCKSPPISPTKPYCTEAFLKRTGEFKSGISNPKGFLGEVATYQNKTSFAQYAQYPWMMVLLKQSKLKTQFINVYQGGGSLIHPKVVITAAHKVATVNPNSLTVRGGEWDTLSTGEICDHVEIGVQKIIQHENFDNGIKNYHNSIALLILKERFQLNNVINVVRLPPHDMNFDGQRCFANGWGKSKFGNKGYYQTFLKKIEVPVVEHNECQRLARTTRLGEDFDLYEGFLCAGGEIGVDTCDGDGGGPLNCEVEGEKDAFYLAGMTAMGIGCHSTIPGFYIKVSHYREWIENKLKSERLTLK